MQFDRFGKSASQVRQLRIAGPAGGEAETDDPGEMRPRWTVRATIRGRDRRTEQLQLERSAWRKLESIPPLWLLRSRRPALPEFSAMDLFGT